MSEPRQDSPATGYPAEKTRQGRIVLNTPLRRAVFVSGLAGAVLLAVLFAIAR